MKIIQINGWLGRLNGPLVDFLTTEQPDIVCLQEAVKPVGPILSPLTDQYGFMDQIVERARLPHIFFAPSWAFEMSGTTMQLGNAILSKTPLLRQVSKHVNNTYYVTTSAETYHPNTRAIQAAQTKVGQSKVLTVANHQAYLAGTHARGDETSVEKIKIVSSFLKELPRPLIFCGDLNVNADTPTIRELDDVGLTNLTAKFNVRSTLSEVHRAPESDRKAVACDYIFVSPEVKVLDFRVADRIVSDHKALVLEFEI